MVFMMNKVVEEGTARNAILDGIKSAGKTGTTNAFRDAWFVGYTGNYVCGVWFGNDDYTSTNQHDRRVAPGADLARHHGLCPSGHRAQAAPGLGPQATAPQRVARAKSDSDAMRAQRARRR